MSSFKFLFDYNSNFLFEHDEIKFNISIVKKRIEMFEIKREMLIKNLTKKQNHKQNKLIKNLNSKFFELKTK